MVACTKPQQMKKEESERLRGERDQIKFIKICTFKKQIMLNKFVLPTLRKFCVRVFEILETRQCRHFFESCSQKSRVRLIAELGNSFNLFSLLLLLYRALDFY